MNLRGEQNKMKSKRLRYMGLVIRHRKVSPSMTESLKE